MRSRRGEDGAAGPRSTLPLPLQPGRCRLGLSDFLYCRPAPQGIEIVAEGLFAFLLLDLVGELQGDVAQASHGLAPSLGSHRGRGFGGPARLRHPGGGGALGPVPMETAHQLHPATGNPGSLDRFLNNRDGQTCFITPNIILKPWSRHAPI